MMQIVQAKCPHCQNTLRIPSDWLNQPMKCKHCQQVFQTKAKGASVTAASPHGNGHAALATAVSAKPLSAPSPLSPAPMAPSSAITAAPPSQGLFGFDPYDDAPAAMPRPSRKKGGNWLMVALLGVGVLGAAAAVYFLAGPHLSTLFKEKKPDDKSNVVVVNNKDNKEPVDPNKDKTSGPKEKKTDDSRKTDDARKTDDSKKTDDGKKIDTVKPKDTKVKNPPNKDKEVKILPKVVQGEFPRRALLINVNNYLYLNALNYGSKRRDKYPGSSTGVLMDQLPNPPMKVPATQITELSDGILLDPKNYNDVPKIDSKRSWPTLKPVIEAAISDFLDTSRAQDRVMIFFAGHAVEIESEAPAEKDGKDEKDKGDKGKDEKAKDEKGEKEKEKEKAKTKSECYLIPVEGNKDDPKSLIPLSWVYKQLADCKARQKVLILDVFRFPPARGFELPGTGEMTEGFDAMLLNPPPGVQVWTSCLKGQQSIEFEGGSAFLQALCGALQEPRKGISNQNETLPLEPLVGKVNTRLKELLDPQKLEQVSRLSGKELESGAPYDPIEPLAPVLALKPPVAPGGQYAGKAQVVGILEELKLIPPVKDSTKQIDYESLPPFRARALELYKPDYQTLKELNDKISKEKDKYALREAVIEMAKMMQESRKLRMRESLTNPGGTVDAKIKQAFKNDQEVPGQVIFEMEQVLKRALYAVGPQDWMSAELKKEIEKWAADNNIKFEKEVSPRWQANYEYAVARYMTRLIYLYEYSNVLAQVRGDNLPEMDPKIHNGFRIGATMKTNVKDVPKVKQYAKDISKIWKKIIEEHADTPWAIIAQRESQMALGLEWRPSRD